MSSTTEYVNESMDSREATLALWYKMADGELTDPADLEELVSSGEAEEEDAEELKAIKEELGGEEFLSEDEAYEHINDFALSVEKKTIVEITLSCGGPTEWLEVECSPSIRHSGLTIDDVTFHAVWGSDRVERSVNEGSALWRFAESAVEGM